MLRFRIGAAILAGILLLNGCASKTKTYTLQVDEKAPKELADALRGKTFHEGQNLLADFDDKDKLYAVIKDGMMESLTLEVKGYKPDTIMRMPDPTPQPGTETPQGCDQTYDNCMAGCTDRCCQLECFFQWRKCLHTPGKPPGFGFTIM
jgi:hypothetical protein